MQAADLSSSYFVLFDLPVSFDIDLGILSERYREAQRAAHPDKFASAADAERRLSVQVAARINEAYRTLKEPLSRGRYLLELQGVDLNDADTAFEGAFLMEQMELRERLAEVKNRAEPEQQLQAIADDIATHSQTLITEMAEQLREASAESLQQARDVTRKLQFFQRLGEEVEVLEDELSDF
jgi:molecular chaperone HscB